MAYRDYILCGKCECKLLYDGYDNGRERLEERWGDPGADTWTVALLCPDCLKAQHDEIARLTAELAASQERERVLREAVKAGIDLTEFWIERGREVNMSDERYNIWLSLGYHSSGLRKMRAALAQEAGDE